MLLTFSGNNSPTQWTWRRGVQRSRTFETSSSTRTRTMTRATVSVWLCASVHRTCSASRASYGLVNGVVRLWCSYLALKPCCVHLCMCKSGCIVRAHNDFFFRIRKEQQQQTFEAAFSFCGEKNRVFGSIRKFTSQTKKIWTTFKGRKQSDWAVTQHKINKVHANCLHKHTVENWLICGRLYRHWLRPMTYTFSDFEFLWIKWKRSSTHAERNTTSVRVSTRVLVCTGENITVASNSRYCIVSTFYSYTSVIESKPRRSIVSNIRLVNFLQQLEC